MFNQRECYLFENLNDEDCKELESISKKVTYKKDNILFYEKEDSPSLILLVEGVVKVYKTDLKNNEVIIRRFRATSLVAEMATFENIPFPASASFETDGTVILIDFKRFEERFMSNPVLSGAIIKSLSRKIKKLEEVIDLNIVLDTTARLAKYLYENKAILDELKNYQIAADLHMTPETLSRTLKKFSILGLLEKGSHGYEVTNIEGLRVLFE
ncbi:MAG: Crp/Fnr family transcriptional regulator [Helicobacteraceae bacterium]|jgi:CRP-like cAMP-binding protein|nr:Crp/Fnr family transcriptional regulator [Helicobacteraceae bacterium]